MWEENGECERARINSERGIEVQYMDAQLENAKKSMVDVLSMNPSVDLMGTADLSVAYSKDFTRLVVAGDGFTRESIVVTGYSRFVNTSDHEWCKL